MSNYACLASPRRTIFGDAAAQAGSGQNLVFYDNLSITLLQKALVSRGYDVGSSGIDGKWGKHTQAAVAEFLVDQGEPNYPAIPDYHVLSDLGISPNLDMMSTATTRTTPPPSAPAGSGGPPIPNNPVTNKPPAAAAVAAQSSGGFGTWQIALAAGLGGIGLLAILIGVLRH